MKRTREAAFETAIESVLLGVGYMWVEGKGSDRKRKISPDEALDFILAIQGDVREKREAPYDEQTDSLVERALCSQRGALLP